MQRKQGFTLFELMIVLTIMGVIAAMVVPGMARYQRKEEARTVSHEIAAAIRTARQKAIREGNNYLVLFDPAVAVNNQQLGVVVQDVNADFAWDAGDIVTRRSFMEGDQTGAGVQGNPATEVIPYGLGGMTPFNGSARHPNDLQPGNLGTVLNGVGFGSDPLLSGISAVFTNGFAFTPQGIPVAAPTPVNTPPVWGSGTGAYYVTDSNNAVFAINVAPLGEVRISSWNPAQNLWN